MNNVIEAANRNSNGLEGVFALLKHRMIEQIERDPYYATRKQIAKAFNGTTAIRYSVPGDSIGGYADVRIQKSRKVISIGCQTFTGKNYTRLKNWALRKD